MNKLRSIHDPSQLTPAEKDFISNTKTEDINVKINKQNYIPAPKKVFKGRMISMSDEFFMDLNRYLEMHPTEGNRSSFIVRVVAEYMKNNQ